MFIKQSVTTLFSAAMASLCSVLLITLTCSLILRSTFADQQKTAEAIALRTTISTLKKQIQKERQQRQYLNRVILQQREKFAAERRQKQEAIAMLEAFSKYPLVASDKRIIENLREMRIMQAEKIRWQEAVTELVTTFKNYLKKEPTKQLTLRVAAEKALRKMAQIQQGASANLVEKSIFYGNGAKIVSLDKKTGLIVFNRGSDHDVKNGMTFLLLRARKVFAVARVISTRKKIAGALITKIKQENVLPKVGDSIILSTSNQTL